MRNVILLTSMHDEVKVSKDQRKKPNVHCFYDHIKGGVDVVDLLSSCLSTRMKCRRWPINSLAGLLDTARTNARTILRDNKVPMSNFEFTYQLGKALVLPSIARRYNNPDGLRVSLLHKMRQILDIPETRKKPTLVHIETKGTDQGRCASCVSSLTGSPGYKVGRENLNN